MHRHLYQRIIPALLLALIAIPPEVMAAEQSVVDAFSPWQGATEMVVSVIDQAQQSIRVAAYSFTSRPIAEALVTAHRRGVDVEVVLDKSQRKHSLAGFLRDNDVPVRINSHYAIMHNKFIISDGKVLELGSFNYTKSAEEKNAENVLVLREQPQIITDYTNQWQKLWNEGETYDGSN